MIFTRKNPRQGLSDVALRWPLDRPLLRLSKRDTWTIGDAVEGTQVFGAIGSGKTSGSGRSIAHALLDAGFGGLVLTVKGDEPELWARYCRETGRETSLVMFGPDHAHGFNFLDYDARRPGGGESHNIVELLMGARREASRGSSSASSTDPFWDDSVKTLLENAVELLLLCGRRLSVPEIDDIVRSAPQSLAQVDDPHDSWHETSWCAECLRAADEAIPQDPDQDPRRATLESVARYWLERHPALPDDTRGGIEAMYTTVVEGFLRGEMRRLFSTTTDILPEMTFEGAVIVLDLPLKRHHGFGRMVQILWKRMWQRAVEDRDTAAHPRPVFLWADEAHNFYTAKDIEFQTTSRSARAATVYLTQNVSNYRAMLTGEVSGDARAATDAFLGTLQTIIFHSNADPVTNEWASEYFAKAWGWRANRQSDKDSAGMSEQLDPLVLASMFQRLRRGGYRDQGIIDAVIARSARPWLGSKQPYLRVSFDQNLKGQSR